MVFATDQRRNRGRAAGFYQYVFGMLRNMPSMQRSLLLLMLGLPATASAVIGTLDPVPAATVLIPYFEADLAANNFPNGRRDTTINVSNATAAAALTSVTVWSDLGVPVVHFNLALAGHGSAAFSLRAVLTGTLPSSSAASPTCVGHLPPPAPSAGTLTSWKNALSGLPASLFASKCVGRLIDDRFVRGYVTIDVVKSCADTTPADASYFMGLAADDNVLLATFSTLEGDDNSSSGELAVHLEASSSSPATTTSGQATFYGRVLGWSAKDHREPLATHWHATVVANDSELIVWRDPQKPGAAFTCGTPPAPLAQETLVAFDTDGQPMDLKASRAVGAVAQAVPVGPDLMGTNPGESLRVMAKKGFIIFSSNLPGSTAGPSTDKTTGQSYVWVRRAPDQGVGRFGTGTRATQLDSATAPSHALVVQ